MHVTSQPPLKIGVVGCGVVATAYYLPYLMDEPRAEIAAVCDLDPVRTAECVRLFGAKHQFNDYNVMLEQAELDAVFILTAPGTHVPFTLAAVEHGLHVLVQKPMALNLEDANKITEAVRARDLKCVIEPSENTLLHPRMAQLRELIDAGVLGKPYWFAAISTAGTNYSNMLGGNPYGNKAFFSGDSGGMLFDFPYTPCKLVTLLGDCKTVSGVAKTSVPERRIVPEDDYNAYLRQVSDPRDCNYWDRVLQKEPTEPVTMEAPDNVFCTYEMDSGWIGTFHVGRPFHPMLEGTIGSEFMIFGEGGNLISGGGHFASIRSRYHELLPEVSEDDWYHMSDVPNPTGVRWPRYGGFNYYHESSRHLIDCILADRDPIVNVEFGRHITEMMWGALESARTGRRYEMTTTTAGLR